MKNIIVIVSIILTCFLLTHITIAQEQIPQKSPNYIEIIKEKYTSAEYGQKAFESWAPGMLSDYGLILDHLEMGYKADGISATTDGKTLVCGQLLIIGYGKTSEGEKKRIISLRSLCHLFNKEVIEKILSINKETNRLLNGWDDSVII